MSTIAQRGFGIRSQVGVLTAADWGVFFVRLALGAVFFAHGAQKVFGWFGGQGLEQTVAGFAKGGIPMPLAYLVCFTELLGGLGLIFGVLSRLSALGISIIMLVAILKFHLPNGFFMNWAHNQKGEGFEYHLLAIGMALMVMLAGPGRLAVMDWEERICRRIGIGS